MTLAPPWRAMSAQDIDAVDAIAGIVHSSFPEDRAIFANRRALYPRGAHVLELEGALAGYCIGHPWRIEWPLALNSLIERLPDEPDTYYLHDLALLPAARGQRLADRVVDHAVALAGGAELPSLSLIAVSGSAPFWERFGFRETPSSAETRAGYGADARFLTLPLSGGKLVN